LHPFLKRIPFRDVRARIKLERAKASVVMLGGKLSDTFYSEVADKNLLNCWELLRAQRTKV
jgi:hypothetical protein